MNKSDMIITTSRHLESLIYMENVCRSYRMGEKYYSVLDKVSLTIMRGQSCAILGASGSGKSTLLNILGLLDQPTSGYFKFNGVNVTKVTSDERAKIRNQEIGFVFQSFNLLPRMQALDNVALPLLYRGYSRSLARKEAQYQLELVGLANRIHYRPADLSGGQRQRVAIARALVGKPSLILADEPTGNLDSVTARDIMTLLLSLNDEQGVTLVMVTHDGEIAKNMQRCLHVNDGRISETNLSDI
ncbi:Lipoprotein-releasing system ATP-binding protein LolD [Photorhabdus australis subsp. thailandensis]|uniref:Lipoprotein-releasing system ATP-binding protein LolD n=1 Tax=Photorhabdus australis subsp. thailandensis TaxID=2805096 RepID=A0A1C0U634_9GAMM|nr:Lipoprotein-releasing system ATP-binding protein LolD [Photorhabdus australis subsp. thailandensis]